MNMQTIQIMILLLDSFIKLAPWRIVNETRERMAPKAARARSMRGMATKMPVPAAWRFSMPHRRQKSRSNSISSNRSKVAT
jgi:hypothetical protein